MSITTGPRQVIVVTTRAKQNGKIKDNAITVAWHTQLSFKPYLYAIAIGKTRYSYSLIKKSKVFCINFIPSKLKKLALFFGKTTGKNIEKLKNIATLPCKKMDCLRLKDALAWLECKVIKVVNAGDHVLFIGEVINEEINKKYDLEKEKRLYHFFGNVFKKC